MTPRLLLLDQAGSTQDELAGRLRAGEEVDAVATGHQTAGRGRHGRSWSSSAGESLAISIALAAPEDFSRAPFVGMAIAARLAARYRVKARWPNDVVCEGRKIAGILVEIQEIASRRWLIAGVGVNLLQTDFPDEIADRAVSLRTATGRELSWREEAEIVARTSLESADASWREIAEEWKAVDATPGKWFREPGREPLRALGVDDAGRLRLDAPEGVRIVSAADAYFGRS